MDKANDQKRNKILYVLFKTITYDLLFYYTLETMFLTLVKGFSFSQVFLITSIDLFFVIVLALPLNFIFKRVSILNRLRIGTLCFFAYILIFLLTNNIYVLCALVIFKSIGNLSISINTTSLLDVIICNDKDQTSKLEGKATAAWWVFEAVSAVVAGCFFQIDPFVSYYIYMAMLVLAFAATFFFKINKQDNYVSSQPNIENKQPKINLFGKYKKLVIAIIILAFSFWGAAEMFESGAKTFLQEIGTDSVILGWIYFAAKMFTATANLLMHHAEKKLGLKFLPVLIGVFFTSVLLMCITYFIDMSFMAKLIIVSIVVCIMYVARNPYRISMKSTMTHCFDGLALEKMFSYYFIAENLGGAIFAFIASFIVDKLNLGWALLICFVATICIAVPALVFYVKYLNQTNRDKIKAEQTESEQIGFPIAEADKVQLIADESINNEK